ncbi:MAG: transporter substrate-binding domain-containing protein [Clostridia bacterium]|nr:transporter substrate-binding domain-containing protein [Clostridia bacterium]
MIRRLFAMVLALSLVAVFGVAGADLLEDVQARGNFVVATEGAWAPWTYHDDSDALVGFDVEVARAIAEKMGVSAEFVECPWESIFMGIDSKLYDITANGVEVTEDRSEKYDFTVPYAYLRTVLIVRGDREDIQTFEDLKGKKTANSAGSTYAQIAEDYGATTDVVSTLAQTLDLVLSERADATLNAELSFYDYMKEHPEANLKIAAVRDDASLVAIPVRKGEENATFLAALNDAITALREDGTLKAISEKYFDVDITAAPED